MSILLNDEHLEVLYILLNDEHDPKYFLPHFKASCAELAENGYIRLLTRIQSKLKPEIEAPGLRAFLTHYETMDIRKALRSHAVRAGMTNDHWEIMEHCSRVPIAATDLHNELTAFDLVNLGYASSLFPHSGRVYYSLTHEGKNALKQHKEAVPA